MPCCGCYNENSTDTRCCGLCWRFCPAKNIDKNVDRERYDFCPNDFHEFWYSGYVQTNTGYGNQDGFYGFCCWLCFPLKCPVFFPCGIGALINQALKKACATTCCAKCGDGATPIKRNYIF